MPKKCQLCKKELKSSQKLKWGRGEIHVTCYTEEKQQDYDTVTNKAIYSGERSPYWDWTALHSFRDDSGELIEFPEANPDVLAVDWDYDKRRDFYDEMIDRVVEKLSPRERQVFNGLKNGLTEDKIAAQLKLDRSSIRDYRSRIKNKFRQYADKEAV